MSNYKPLEGVRVIELASYVAAPSAGRLLADMGAEVIRVESFKGDVWRWYGANVHCPVSEQENPLFDTYNSNKRDILLDIKNPEGKEILFHMMEQADVFLTNNRPKALVNAGIDYDSIKDRFPRLIYALITGYGLEGPDAAVPGYDGIAFFARSGMLADAADPEGFPCFSPGGLGDAATGEALFGAICAALYAREKTGKGDFVDVSLYGNAVWLFSCQATITQDCYGDVFPKKRANMDPMLAPYKCRDGEWLMLSVTQYKRHFAPICEALDIPWLIDDPRCADNLTLIQHNTEIFPILEEAFAKLDSDEVLRRFAKSEIVADRLRHYRELADDEQALANDYMRKFTYESGNTASVPMTPIHSVNSGSPSLTRGPWMGEHTEEILREFGYSDEEVEELKAKDIVRQHE